MKPSAPTVSAASKAIPVPANGGMMISRSYSIVSPSIAWIMCALGSIRPTSKNVRTSIPRAFITGSTMSLIASAGYARGQGVKKTTLEW